MRWLILSAVVCFVGPVLAEDVLPSGKLLIPGGTLSDGVGGEISASSFRISGSEVSWGEWLEVIGESFARGYDLCERGRGDGPHGPVHSVTWHDVIKWCNLRSEVSGRTTVYTADVEIYRSGKHDQIVMDRSADGYRLLTDAEWEFAVRWGEQVVLSGDTEERAALSCFMNRAAMIEDPSGRQELSANLWEWVFNLHPSCEMAGRIIRGGRESNMELHCRIGLQGSYQPDQFSEQISFRVVLPDD